MTQYSSQRGRPPELFFTVWVDPPDLLLESRSLSPSLFPTLRADFVTPSRMPRRPAGAAPKPRGRPRKAFEDLKPAGKRWRRWRDGEKQPVAAIIVACQTPTTECKKRGRPPMPFAKLKKASRYRRIYRARLAEQHVPQLLMPLMTAAAELEAQEAAQQQAEAALRKSRQARLDKQLAERNPEGRNGYLLHESVQRECPRGPCGVCYTDTRTFTPCCSAAHTQWLCATCVNRNALVYTRTPRTSGAPRDGGPVPQIDCSAVGSRCPMCNRDDVFSVGARALRTARA